MLPQLPLKDHVALSLQTGEQHLQAFNKQSKDYSGAVGVVQHGRVPESNPQY